MVVVDVDVVVVEGVAAPEGSDVSGSLVGTEVVVVVVVEVVLELAVVIVGTAVIAGSDVSSAPSAEGVP